MSTLPIRTTRQKLPTGNRSAMTSVNPSALVLLVKISFVALVCGSSYIAGSLWGRHSLETHVAPLSVGILVRGGGTGADVAGCEEAREKWIELRVLEGSIVSIMQSFFVHYYENLICEIYRTFLELDKHAQDELPHGLSNNNPNPSISDSKRFPTTMEKFATGIARVKKDDLDAFFNFGNPVEVGAGSGDEDAIIIYNDKKAMPSDKTLAHAAQYNTGEIPLMDPQTATANCDGMNVIFTGNPEHTAQCTAIIGNYESYHIQRWMRTDGGKIDHNLPLAQVSRGFAPRGKANFYAPPYDGKNSQVKRHWKMLLTFLQNVDSVLEELAPILKKVARNNAVVVLTCNHGQSGKAVIAILLHCNGYNMILTYKVSPISTIDKLCLQCSQKRIWVGKCVGFPVR